MNDDWTRGPLCQVADWFGMDDGTNIRTASATPGPINGDPVNKAPSKAAPGKTSPENTTPGKTAADVITGDMLKGIAGKKVATASVAHYLSEGIAVSGITSEVGQAMFIAETAVESTYYTKLFEGGGKVAYDSVTKKHRNFHPKKDKLGPNETEYDYFEYLYDINSPVEKHQEHARKMGNTTAGDGEKYRGRGYIQITGKKNYDAAGKDLKLDLVTNPDLAAQPENAAKIAGWFWKTNHLNTYSNTDSALDFERVSYIINVGSLPKKGTLNDKQIKAINGLADRQRCFALAKKALGIDKPAK